MGLAATIQQPPPTLVAAAAAATTTTTVTATGPQWWLAVEDPEEKDLSTSLDRSRQRSNTVFCLAIWGLCWCMFQYFPC